MSGNIQKPITIIRAEFVSNLTNLINNSMLPPFIIEPILKDMYTETRMASQKQLEADIKQYQELLEFDKRNNNDEPDDEECDEE